MNEWDLWLSKPMSRWYYVFCGSVESEVHCGYKTIVCVISFKSFFVIKHTSIYYYVVIKIKPIFQNGKWYKNSQ